jgi:hypothetical protein
VSKRPCKITDCERPSSAKGWCNLHYQRWLKGTQMDLPVPAPANRRSPEERLWGNIVTDALGCWIWQGNRDRKGYGRISVKGRTTSTHRLAYRLAHGGDIPDGLVVRHRCDNPPCVNPDHLEIGTPADNSRDMVERGRMVNCKAGRTHCPKGHPFDEANTYWWNNARQCRACKNDYLVRKRDSARPDRVRKVTGDERAQLRSRAAALHGQGVTIKGIAADLGRSTGLVQDLLKEAGVTPRPRTYRPSAPAKADAR